MPTAGGVPTGGEPCVARIRGGRGPMGCGNALMPAPRPALRSTTRSASATSAGRWATTITVRPRTSRGHRGQHLVLGRAVEVGGRLVEQQQRRVAEEQARQRDAAGARPPTAPRRARRPAASQPAAAGSPGPRPGQPRQLRPATLRVGRVGARQARCCRRSSRRTGAAAAASTPAATARRRDPGRRARRSPIRTDPVRRARRIRAARSSSVDFPQPLAPGDRDDLARRHPQRDTRRAPAVGRPGSDTVTSSNDDLAGRRIRDVDVALRAAAAGSPARRTPARPR